MPSLSLQLFDNEELRGMTYEGKNVYAVYDFVNSSCGRTGTYGVNTFKRLLDDPELKEELEALIVKVTFPGRGQQKTYAMDIRGLSRLCLILKGKFPKLYRAQAETTVNRVLAGDTSLIKVIQANSKSNDQMNVQIREALAANPLPGDNLIDDLALKRKREDEILDLQEKRLAIQERTMVLSKEVITAFKECNELMQSFGGWDQRDITRNKALISNHIAAICQNASAGSVLALEPAREVPLPLSFAIVAKKMNIKEKIDYKKAGRIASDLFFEKHNKRPFELRGRTTEYLENGLPIEANAYVTEDEPILMEALRKSLEPPPVSQRMDYKLLKARRANPQT